MGHLSYFESMVALNGGSVPRAAMFGRPGLSALPRRAMFGVPGLSAMPRRAMFGVPGLRGLGYRGGLGQFTAPATLLSATGAGMFASQVPTVPATWVGAQGAYAATHSPTPGVYYPPDVADKQAALGLAISQITGQVQQLRGNFTNTKAAIASTLAPTAPAAMIPGYTPIFQTATTTYDPTSAQFSPIDAQISDLEQFVQKAQAFVSGFTPPAGVRANTQIATDEWNALNHLSQIITQAQAAIPQIAQSLTQIQAQFEQTRQQQATATTQQQSIAAQQAAELAAQQAQQTAAQQAAAASQQTQYQEYQAQLAAQQQAQAQAQASSDAAAAAQATQQQSTQQMMLQLVQAQQAAQAQKESDAMQLQMQQLQQQDADAQAQAAGQLQAQQAQAQLTLQLAMLQKGYNPAMVMGSGMSSPYGASPYGAPGGAPPGLITDPTTGMLMDPSTGIMYDPSTLSQAGPPMGMPTSGTAPYPYMMQMPAAAAAPSSGSGVDMSPWSPGNEMFGMRGMGAMVSARQANPGLPLGAQIQSGYSVAGIDSRGFLIVMPEGGAPFRMSFAQANKAGVRVSDPRGRLFYVGPGGASGMSGLGDANVDALQTAMANQQTAIVNSAVSGDAAGVQAGQAVLASLMQQYQSYAGSLPVSPAASESPSGIIDSIAKAITGAAQAGQSFYAQVKGVPVPPKPVAAAAGVSTGGVVLLGAAAIGTAILIGKALSKKPAKKNPGRRRRRRNRGRRAAR